MAKTADITTEYVRSILDYNPVTGEFIHKKRGYAPWDAKWYGKIAGTIDGQGRCQLWINKKSYRAHRIAWLIMTGSFPDNQLDHINMNKDDNRFGNLRKATRSQNHMNRRAYSNNKLGCKGVHRHGSKFRAMIKKDGEQICLGLYPCVEQAKAAYANASVLMHGAFSRLD